MCLKINKKYHPDLTHLIANKDIYTLKLSKYDFKRNKAKSYFIENLQSFSLLPKITFSYSYFGEIEKGYHSVYKANDRNCISGIQFDGKFVKNPLIIILCKIPKGSKYFIGYDGEIVSNQLELIQPILCNEFFKNEYFSKSDKNNDSAKFDYLDNNLFIDLLNKYTFNICIKHCKEAGYKIGL